MGCSLCDFLWTHISSDKSNSLNWSNEQTIPTSLSDTKVSQTGGCGNHVAVRGGQAVPRLWLLQTSDSPNDECMCFLSHIHHTLSLALVCDWFWLLPWVTVPWLGRDGGASPQEGVGCPSGQSCPDTCTGAILGMRAASCSPPLLTGPCSSRSNIKSDRNSDFAVLLVPAVSASWQSCLEDCSWGNGDRGSCNLWGVPRVSVGVTQVWVPWAWELHTHLQCLVQAGPEWERALMTQGFVQPCSWKVILQGVSFAALVLLTLMLSETQCNSHVPIIATLCLLWSWCLFSYLAQTHAERNAQNWSPW